MMQLYRIGDDGQRVPYNVVPVEFQKGKRETVIPGCETPVETQRITRSSYMLGVVMIVLFSLLWFLVGYAAGRISG